MRKFGGIFDYDGLKEQHEELALELKQPEVWNDTAKITKITQTEAALRAKIEKIEKVEKHLINASDYVDFYQEEPNDTLLEDMSKELEEALMVIEGLEFARMFSGEHDKNDAYVDIQAGSGGTESQDWAEMLTRMYTKWADSKGFKTEIEDVHYGEVAGIKSITLKVSGEYAFGWLRTESGVHRLVRKSPFDSGNRRHTSFAGVYVYPDIDDNIEVNINPADLRVDTYRASGAGGQHVNRTESAIRITHLPTNTVVQCQANRSQHANRDQAMRQLRSKLYELELNKRRDKAEEVSMSKSDISWGSQIRSYVLDQSRIKDLRTGVESHNTQNVLDGNLDPFIIASLQHIEE